MNKERKIKIIGAGVAGSYLAHKLSKLGIDVSVYEKEEIYDIGRQCAWAVNIDKLSEYDLVRPVEEYAMSPRMDTAEVVVGDRSMEVGLKNLKTIEKPRLLKDWQEESDADFHYNTKVERDDLDSGMVIDATGASRAILGEKDVSDGEPLPCHQVAVAADEPFGWKVKWTGAGYLWQFPLSRYLTFIGCGDYEKNPKKVVNNYVESLDAETNVVEREGAVIRATPPQKADKYEITHRQEIVGVGESIGCIAPLTGGGILPSLKSVHILLNTIKWQKRHSLRKLSNGFSTYSSKIDSEFKKFKYESRLAEAIQEGRNFAAIHNACRIGNRPNAELSWIDKLKLVNMLIRYG